MVDDAVTVCRDAPQVQRAPNPNRVACSDPERLLARLLEVESVDHLLADVAILVETNILKLSLAQLAQARRPDVRLVVALRHLVGKVQRDARLVKLNTYRTAWNRAS